jgi:substrate-binding family protein
MFLPRLLKSTKRTLPNTRSKANGKWQMADGSYRHVFYLLLTAYGLLTSCAPFQLTRPVTKIGLVAPFEGRQRAVGYEALYAVKLALRERNDSGGVAGWSVELVALDDSAQLAQSLRQARALAVDPDVTRALVLVAASEDAPVQAEYARLGLPVSLVASPTPDGAPPDASFVARYRALSDGITPGALATRTYALTQALLAQIEQRVRAQGRPTR